MKWIKWWQSSEMKYILLGSPYGPLGFSGYSYGYGLNAQPLYAFLPLYSAIKWNVHTFRILIARHVKLILIAQSCFQVRTQKVLSRFADRRPRDQYFQKLGGKNIPSEYNNKIYLDQAQKLVKSITAFVAMVDFICRHPEFQPYNYVGVHTQGVDAR